MLYQECVSGYTVSSLTCFLTRQSAAMLYMVLMRNLVLKPCRYCPRMQWGYRVRPRDRLGWLASYETASALLFKDDVYEVLFDTYCNDHL